MSVFTRQALNWCVTIGSVVACILALFAPIPGIELFGIKPNWLLIWLVAWSLKRTMLSGAMIGLVLGFILDGVTAVEPTHVLPFVCVGILTVLLYKKVMKKMQEDFISVALIVFGMAILVETIRALQFSLYGDQTLIDLWVYQQRVALSSAILSSLWAPVIYFPLNCWWDFIKSSHSSHYSS